LPGHVFISHTTHDDNAVAEIRTLLESLGLPTWVDSRRLRGGDELAPEIAKAIEDAGYVLAVLGPRTVNSPWVKREIDHALVVGKTKDDGYRVVPVLLPGIEPSALDTWFPEEPVAVRVPDVPNGIQEALPALTAALGLVLPEDVKASLQPEVQPVAELVLELEDPGIDTSNGRTRATARARLRFRPPEGSQQRAVTSRRFSFTAPLGPIETGEIAWYLERYCHWPSGVFQERALQVEKKLEDWGRLLAEPLLSRETRNAFEAWDRTPPDVTRRFSVLVDDDASGSAVGQAAPADSRAEEESAGAACPSPDGEAEKRDPVREGATLLLSLPWELVHDGKSFLFKGKRPVQVRRRLPNREVMAPLVTKGPIRVLLVSPRPEDDRAVYIDHRVSARPVVEALEALGDGADVTLLSPPTLKALEDELLRAGQAGRPYHVVHFDGHGVYDRKHGLGGLCFENPSDAGKLEKRRSEIVMAGELAEVMREHRVPLVFLEACETARAEEDPTSSVAGRLLEGGVASVVAMSHKVLVETARRFVGAFYRELMAGRRIGDAMLAGQRDLQGDTYRGKVFKGELHLHDWFVPVLFQEELDPQLIERIPSEQLQAIDAERRRRALGKVPEEPEHHFVGRSRELLAAERLLARERHAVILGEGGEGKTTLASELVRWLVKTRRFRRAAFVSMEHALDARTVLFELGGQLVPDFVSQAAQDESRPWQLVERALRDDPTIVIVDNMETVLPGPAADAAGNPPPGPLLSQRRGSKTEGEASDPVPPFKKGGLGGIFFEPRVLQEILDLCRKLTRTGTTRVVFTSRESLPEPFTTNHVRIGRLEHGEAIELVGRVLGEGALMPHAADEGESEEEIEKLVDAVACHARSLVLLAREVSASGVRRATERLGELMAALAEKHPDDRERSLFASVELSLRRLPEATRQRLPRLAVFQGGGHGWVIAVVLGLDYEKDEEVILGRQLAGVGLAEIMPYGHLRLHPALGPALDRELSDEERDEARRVWVEAMAQLTGYLRQQRFKDVQQAATLTLLELPNLLAALDRLHETADVERVIGVATDIESLLQNLGRPKALARAARIREDASRRLGEHRPEEHHRLEEHSHGRFLAESAAVDRLLDAGRFAEAAEAAGRVVQRGLAAGEAAFAEAAYDLAMAHFSLGRALQMGGAAEAALTPLAEAEKRFRKLADAGNVDAAGMAGTSLAETGDCLAALGRLDEAARAYEASIALAEELDDRRGSAVAKGQLGTVRLLQQRYGEALAACSEAREIFERLGEPGTVAVAWHQIGRVHQRAGQHEAAEHAYQQSLKIEVQRGDRSGEASSLNQLGGLYDSMGRLEESVRFLRQAAAIYTELEDLAGEGRQRSNIAIGLIKLRRYDEARQEILRAIECKEPYGHASEPWKTFDILHDLERAVGNDVAAVEARERALQAYLAYRRAGGENHTPGGRLAAIVGQALAAGQTGEVASQLAELRGRPGFPDVLQPFISALQAILSGSRDPALASDPGLFIMDAAEIVLLLEASGEAPGGNLVAGPTTRVSQ